MTVSYRDRVPKSVLKDVSRVLEYMRVRGAVCPDDIEEKLSYDGTTTFLLFYMLEKEGLIEKIDPENKQGAGHYFKVISSALGNNLLQQIKKIEEEK